MLLPKTVTEAARRFGDEPAVVSHLKRPLSFKMLDKLSDEAAVGLAKRGVKAGDIVAITLPSSIEYIVGYCAAAKIGAATAGINPRLAPPEQESALELLEPSAVLTLPGQTTGPGCIDIELSEEPEDALRTLRVAGETPEQLPDDDSQPVAIILTSGTTGKPRAAMFTDAQLAAIGRIDAGDAWGGGRPMLAATELAHVGFMTKLAWYLRAGNRIHLLRRWRAAEALRVIADERMEAIGGIAPQIALMLRVPDFDSYDLSAVKTIVAGGASSPPSLVLEARDRFNAAYSIRYSSTESGGVGTATGFAAADEEALFTVGRPRSGVQVEIRTEAGRLLPRGVIGEVWLSSPAVMSGYWRDPVAAREVLRDGWVRMGDLGSIDDAGCLRLAGRRNDMYIRGGYNVHPEEVEATLSSHPAVASVAVVPRNEPVMGEVGVAVVVPTDPENPPDLESLRAFAAPRLAAYKLPEDLVIVDALPLTSMEKINRRALAERVASAEPSNPARSG